MYFMTWLNTFRFLSLLFTALALGAGLAHLFELSSKMKLSAKDYLTVQQIYRGWSLLGIVAVISLLSTLAVAIMVPKQEGELFFVLSALICIIGTLVIFGLFTYPVNQETKNWTVLPDNWLALRSKWEFSHAAGALLNLTALILLILSVLSRR
jgi:hypothetical protein